MKTILTILLFAANTLAQSQSYVLVLNKQSNTLSFVNTATMKMESTVAVGVQPHEMAITPDRTKAYVSNVGANTLSVIDLKNRKATKTITSSDFQFPHGIVFTKDAKRALVTSEQKKKIIVIDAERDEIIRAIDTDQGGTHMVVLSPDGRWAYFTNRDSNTVSIMDVDSTAIVANIPAGDGVEGIALSPDGKQIWAPNRRGNSITTIDTEKRQALSTIPTGPGPIRAAYSPDGKMIFIPTSGSGEVHVYEAASRNRIKVVKVGASPGGVIFSPDGKYAFVACAGSSNEVHVIDSATLTVTAKVPVERGPDGIEYWISR